MENYWLIVILAAVIGAIGAILALVPTLYLHLRRRREPLDTSAPPQSPEQSVETERAQQRLAEVLDSKRNALGWTTDKNGGRLDDSSILPGMKSGNVLGREKTILVADDDPVVLQSLSHRLQREGYQVLRSPDAAYALMGIMKVVPDAVILDVNMPSGNGLAVCEMMASDPRYAKIPVIIHSAFADEATKNRCLRLGAYHVEKSARSWNEIKTLLERLFGEESAAPAQKELSAAAEEALPTEVAVEDDSRRQTVGGDSGRRLDNQPQPPSESIRPSEDRRQEPPPTIIQEDRRQEPGPTIIQEDRRQEPGPTIAQPAKSMPAANRRMVICLESPKGRLESVEHQLSALGIEVLRTADLEEGFWSCFTEKPIAMIAQIADNKKALVALLCRVARHPVTRTLPVMVVNENNLVVRDDLPAEAKVKFFEHPLDWENLLCELEAYFPAFHQDELTHPTAPARAPSSAPAAGAKAAGFKDEPQANLNDLDRILKPPARKELHKILCIDDDPVVARTIAIRLQPYGIKVLGATTGTEGYIMATTELPDVILLDLKMPGGEGNFIIGKLKGSAVTSGIPVLVLTIMKHAGMRREMFSLGASAYLNKPIDWHELFEELNRCVQLPKQIMIDYKVSGELEVS